MKKIPNASALLTLVALVLVGIGVILAAGWFGTAASVLTVLAWFGGSLFAFYAAHLV